MSRGIKARDARSPLGWDEPQRNNPSHYLSAESTSPENRRKNFAIGKLLEITVDGSPTFGNGTVTTRTLLDCPVVARYIVPWGRFS